MKLVNSDILDRAVLETLETRQMLTAVSFDSGVLSVTGLSNRSNAIQLKLQGDRVLSMVNGAWTSRQYAGIKSINIVGGDESDYIEVEQKITVPVTILAKAGKDRIVGGGGNDFIEGGAGNDIIHGGKGNDKIYGNAGIDRVYAGRGDDLIDGGVGNDIMFGDDGNDTFVLVERHDKVVGGYGVDSLTADPSNKPAGSDTTPAPQPEARVTGFSLIDASTNKVVNGYESIQIGAVLDLSKLPSKLAISANLDGQSSVRFDYDGKKMYHIENAVPYALAGDTAGKFKSMNFSLGTHTLSAHAVVKNTGEVLSSAGITFNVIRSSSLPANNNDKPASTDGNSQPTPDNTNTGGNTDTGGNTNTGGNTDTGGNTNNGGNTNTGTGDGNDNGTVLPPSNNQNGAAPEAHINAISTTIPAGTSVHLDALATKLNSGDWNDGQYLWDFGDAGSRYNKLKGFSASHAFDQPGQYTVTLTVINEAGKQDKATLTINVSAASRKVIYVASDGSDSNSGLSASSPIKSFAKAASLLGDNTEILFRRGDTFSLSDGMWIKQNNVLIGAYGIGDRPTLLWTGDRVARAIINTTDKAQNITIQDLTLDTRFNQDTNDRGTPLGFSPDGKNITIRRNEFLNLQFGVNLNQRPDGVMIQDNVAPLLTGIRKYFVWVEGDHISIVGNKAVNSTREHIVRVNFVSKLLVMDNDFANISRRNSGDYWDYRKTALNVQSGEFAYLADNKLDGPFQIGPLGKADGLKYPWRRFNYAIAEGNTVINDSLEINHGAQHITVRHNVFNVNGFNAINIDGWDSTYGRGVVDLTIANNTGVNNDSKGRFIEVHAHVDGFRLVNNLYVAPNLKIGVGGSAGIKVDEGNLSSFTEIDGNIWPVSTNIASWVGEQAMNYIGSDYVKGFQTATEWNNHSQVGTDTFTNIRLSAAKYTTLNGRIVGASLAA